jgi:hypothetical protein
MHHTRVVVIQASSSIFSSSTSSSFSFSTTASPPPLFLVAGARSVGAGARSVGESSNRFMAREDPSPNATLTQDLVAIAEQEDFELDDQDVNYVVIYDSVWDVGNVTTSEGQHEVFLTDFITGERGNA